MLSVEYVGQALFGLYVAGVTFCTLESTRWSRRFRRTRARLRDMSPVGLDIIVTIIIMLWPVLFVMVFLKRMEKR